MNLLVSARDAMPAGGDVTIETSVSRLTKPLERDRVIVSPGEYISVKVIDQGMGMKPDVLSKIFEPFYTTKPTGEGTGLGLSMVYGIMEQSGGYVFVDSDLGESSCFTLLFPAHQGVVDDSYAQGAPVPKEASSLGREVPYMLVNINVLCNFGTKLFPDLVRISCVNPAF